MPFKPELSNAIGTVIVLPRTSSFTESSNAAKGPLFKILLMDVFMEYFARPSP